jgi:hypothetical protein
MNRGLFQKQRQRHENTDLIQKQRLRVAGTEPYFRNRDSESLEQSLTSETEAVSRWNRALHQKQTQ